MCSTRGQETCYLLDVMTLGDISVQFHKVLHVKYVSNILISSESFNIEEKDF